MPFLIDTDVAIHMRDGTPYVLAELRALRPPIYLSIISRIELENGVYRERTWTDMRRRSLDVMLGQIKIVDFGEEELSAYRNILEIIGYHRQRTHDRMIAATAIAHGLTLVTMNGKDYRDVPKLKLEVWINPGS